MTSRQDGSRNHRTTQRLLRETTAAAVVAFAALTAASAQKVPPAVCGIVDEDRLQQQYKQFQEDLKALQAFQADLRQKIKERVLLTEDEWQELDTLESKAEKDLDAKQKERLAALRKMSGDRDKELTELQGIAEPNDAQKKRRQELENIGRTIRRKWENYVRVADKSATDRKNELQDKLSQTVRDAVVQIATQRGLNLVIEKKRTIWSEKALDITEEVIKKLNE